MKLPLTLILAIVSIGITMAHTLCIPMELNSRITPTRYIIILVSAIVALAIVLLGCDNTITLHVTHDPPGFSSVDYHF